MNDSDKNQNKKQNDNFFPFQDEIKDLFSRLSDEWPDLAPLNQEGYVPHVDLKEEGDFLVLMAEIPGMKEEDIQITLERDVLVIEGEKKSQYEDAEGDYLKSEISYGRFSRSIPLSVPIDESKVKASYQDGVLKIRMPKKSEREAHKKIKINE